MNVESLCKRVTQFGFMLLEAEFALDAKPHKIENLTATQKSLIWVRESDGTLMSGNPSKIGDYLSLLERREYSYLMYDGGVIQIAFIYNRGEVIRHRLYYHPCPFRFEPDDLVEFNGGLLDFIIDGPMSDLDESLLLRAPVRFDYAPNDAAEFHPASHITINDPDCRIPVRSPLHFDTFMKFVLENFYLEAWKSGSLARELTLSQEEECLSAHDRGRAHLNWTHP